MGLDFVDVCFPLQQYTTAMRYKAAAKKLKQVVELADPMPADVVVPRGAEERKGKRDYGADEEAVVETAREGGGREDGEGEVVSREDCAREGGVGDGMMSGRDWMTVASV